MPVETYQSNLRKIAGQLRQDYPEAGIIFITPSVYNRDLALKHEAQAQLPESIRDLRTKANHRLYAATCLETARSLGVPVVDAYRLHEAEIESGTPVASLLPDGVHFTTQGYSVRSGP